MTEEQIELLGHVNGDTARDLIEAREFDMYFDMVNMLVELVRNHEVKVELGQLQFIYSQFRHDIPSQYYRRRAY